MFLVILNGRSSKLMRRYSGILQYTTDNSGRVRRQVNVGSRASFLPGHFEVIAEGEQAYSVHTRRSRRFNYQARFATWPLSARKVEGRLVRPL